jgi:endonuclease-3
LKLELIMTKSEKVADILNILDQYFPNPEVPLHHKDAYTLLISVLLSAQCTDERVNKTTPSLFKLADNPFDMVKLSVEEIKEIIRPCGLSPMKSKGIYGLSQIIIEKHNGQVPNTFEALEELPAVGHKTASVVMTQWFGIPAFPVDTHIHRLAYRWGLTTGKNVEQTEKDLKRLIPEEKWNKVHLQLIYFGRAFCPARGHNWQACPICSKYMRKELRD